MRGPFALIFLAVLLAASLPSPASSAASSTEPTAWGPLVPSPSQGDLRAPPPVPLDAPFGANVRASEDTPPGNQNEITMAIALDGRIHMGWNDLRSPNPDYRCGYSYSADGGFTWSANRLFHLDPWDANGDPVVTVGANDTVYFICMPFSRSGGGSLVVAYTSTDGGATFGPAVSASDTTTGFNDKPWALATGTTLHVCYTNFVGGGTELRYTRSTDGGATFEPTRVLDYNGQGCTFASDGSRLHLAWSRGGWIYALRSTDDGVTWTTPRQVGVAAWSSDPEQRAYNMPAMAADPATGNVYVVWTANDLFGTWDVFSSRSTDAGLTWNSRVAVNDVRLYHQFMPAVAVTPDGGVHVAYYDRETTSGSMQVRYATSTNAGATWSASTRVTDAAWTATCSGPNCPVFIGDYIAVAITPAGYVAVGWCDRRSGENEAYFASTAPAPPELARIEVTPPEAWTDADTPVTFSGVGYDQYDQSYPVIPTWEATGGTVIGGAYTPERIGDWQVWANASGISGSAVVHVSAGILAQIEVTPTDATITADDTLQYTATGFDANGNRFSFAPSWGVTDGTIAPDGLFAPRRAGSWTVYANASGISGSTSVTVTGGALARIDVTPPTATITADETAQFTASGYDAKENPVPVSPSWAATGGAVDGSGLYAPARVGTWTVYANASGVVGTAEVTVVPGRLARIEIAPEAATITADDVLQFSATGYDAKDNVVTVTPEWSVTGGSIDPSGRYTPQRVGAYVVTATVDGVSDATTVTVVPGRLSRIDVTPPTATITADDVLQLTANGYDANENAVAISPVWAAGCGSVDGIGLYTPWPAGACLVYANESGVSGLATITVVPGRLARIDVTPPTAGITADDTTEFGAHGSDAKGNAVVLAPAWSVTEGTIDASGRYAPRLVGTWEVRAEQAGVAGTAQVTVLPGALATIDVTPPTAAITADATVRFTATGRDAKGNGIALTSPVWSADDGSVTEGLFEPSLVGAWTVSAEEGGVRGTARVTVAPGAVARVVIAPGTARVSEGGVVAFTAHAYDAKGNAVPDAVFAWQVEGDVGTVSGTGTFRADHAGAGGVVATASDGSASVSAAAPVTVDASLVSASAPWFALLVVAGLALAVVAARRRRRRK